MLFKSQTPGPVQIVIRVSAEGDHGLGAGDAGDLGYSLGDDFGEPLEVGDTDHYDEVVGACDRVSLGDAVYREHGLGGFLNALPLRPDQHYCRYHAGPLHHITIKMIHIACRGGSRTALDPKRHPPRQRVVGRTLLVLDGPGLDGGPGRLVEFAGYKAADLDRSRLLGFEARYGLALGLAFGVRVKDDLPVRVQRLPRDLYGRHLHAVQGVRVAPRGVRRGGRVEPERPVIHKRLRLFEVRLIARLAGGLKRVLDGRDVVVGDDAVAYPVVIDGRRELLGKPAGISRSSLYKLVCGLGPYAQCRDDVVMGVLELRRYLLLPQSLKILLFGSVGHLGELLLIQLGRVPSSVGQDALKLPPARVGGIAQEAVRARDILADLGRLLVRHAAAGDEEDKPEY